MLKRHQTITLVSKNVPPHIDNIVFFIKADNTSQQPILSTKLAVITCKYHWIIDFEIRLLSLPK